MNFSSHIKQDILLVGVFILISTLLFFLPTGFDSRIDKKAIQCKGVITKVDNSSIQQFGMIKAGDQEVSIRILDGPFKNRVVNANNPLLGQMDRDKVFNIGDTAFVVLSLDKNKDISFVNPQAHYRIGTELILLLLFSVALIIFGGWTGIKALLSFVFTGMALWKILVPGLLKGYHPIWLSLFIVALLTAIIIFLVAGLNRKGLTAFIGASMGMLTSCFLAFYFTNRLHIHGAVMPFAETLLYSGFGDLNLTYIYVSAVFLAASGAVMDLAMDVAASMYELSLKKTDISRIEIIKSGLSVGRAVVGTMTTTLLLAYSGGYITLLMAFMAQGVPLSNLFNLIYVAAEVLKTLVGSFGLVMVAPFTAIVGGFIMVRKKQNRSEGYNFSDSKEMKFITTPKKANSVISSR